MTLSELYPRYFFCRTILYDIFRVLAGEKHLVVDFHDLWVWYPGTAETVAAVKFMILVRFCGTSYQRIWVL